MINTIYKDLIPNITLDEFFENNKGKVETRTISYYLNPKNTHFDPTKGDLKEIIHYKPSVGDIVRLKSGGPDMTVRSILSDGNYLIVLYFDGNKIIDYKFNIRCLNVVSSINDIESDKVQMETHDYTGIFINFRKYDKEKDNIIPYGRISEGSATLLDTLMGTTKPTPYKDADDVVMMWIRKISDIEKTNMANNGLNFTENFYKVGIFTNELK
jgi:uncharacterized protein YodC (DUF2158 family)